MKNLLYLLLFTFFFSCNSNTQHKKILANSNGRMNEILLVMESQQWKGTLGDELRNIIGAPVIGLPQEESLFSVSQIPLKAFDKLLKRGRNILIVKIGETNAMKIESNIHAEPQKKVTLTGTSEESIINLLQKNKEKLVATFKDFDIKNVQKRLSKSKFPNNKFISLKNFNIKLSIPNYFKTVIDEKNFLWLRQHLSGGIAKGDGTNNILVYTIPFNQINTDSLSSSIVKMRDHIGKTFIPGRKENMYMITEKAFSPYIKKINFNNKTAFETKGKWEVKNDFMAGPFINYMIEDTKNNRWVVVEGFTYAPSVDKREYMFELEAILKTAQF